MGKKKDCSISTQTKPQEATALVSQWPRVTVIIPVYNDTERLSYCLNALNEQTYPQENFEVIVVDNGSDDCEALKSLVANYPRVKLVEELNPGSYHARNQGLAMAEGEVIAFTDADCIPYPDWLEKGVARLVSVPNCGLVAGRVDLMFQQADSPTALELYQKEMTFLQEHYISRPQGGGSTANMFTYKAIFECVGLFDASLKSGGDSQWGQRVRARGFELVYDGDIGIRHPARASWAQLQQRTRRISGGIYDRNMNPNASFWDRQLIFISLVKNELHQLRQQLSNLFETSRFPKWGDRVRVLPIVLAVRGTSLAEKIRLKLGGKSLRS